MKTTEELRRFYDTVLREDLQALEDKRKRLVNTCIITFVAVVVAGLAGLAIMGAMGGPGPVVFIFPVFALVIGGVIYGVQHKDYARDFKEWIIARLVEFVDKSLVYSPHSCIAQSDYMASKIFRQRPDRYTGDDHVNGRIGATQMQFSELHSEYKTTSRDSKGHTQTHWHTIFKGLFFIADFNKHFTCELFVLPDTAEKLFGRFGQKLQSLNVCRGQLVKLEDPEFERRFVVYADDQIQARYILSTSLMQRITSFQTRHGRPVHMSFVGSRIYVAISCRQALFEPRVFSTLLDFAAIEEYYNDLDLAVGIVEDLNLNTRIWMKS